MASELEYPQRPQSHVTGDVAVAIFRETCPSDWLTSSIQNDYGLDLRVELVSQGRLTGEEFFVQIKGGSAVEPDSEGAVRLSVQQSTINYWLAKLHPVLVVFVEVPQKQFWYNWLEYAYKEFPTPSQDRKSCSLILPVKTGPINFSGYVENYVKAHFAVTRSAKEEIVAFKCPFCGAPLVERGGEFVASENDHYGLQEVFACGHHVFDWHALRPCPSDPEFPRFEDFELHFHHDSSAELFLWSCYPLGKTDMARKLGLHCEYGQTQQEAQDKVRHAYNRRAKKFVA